MNVEIIAIGNEILNGTVIDTNSAWLGQECQGLGIEIRWRQSVRDNHDDMVAAIQLATERADLIVCCGGLGPTVDDITAIAVAAAVDSPIAINEEALSQVTAHRQRAGRQLGPIDDKQAELPRDAAVLNNPVGTAPGFQVVEGGATIICLPGVPSEWRAMCELHVLPWLRARVKNPPTERTWKFFGVTESRLAMSVNDLDSHGLALHYRAHFPEIHLRAVTHDPSRLQSFEQALMAAQGLKCFSQSDASFASVVNQALRDRGWTLATAESCTGGLISQMITAVPGSSDVFSLGWTTYSNDAKHAQLGVSKEILQAHGTVSAEVVEAMANAARVRADATLAVAVSGIAGPNGGTPEKPVGTVFVALATPEGTLHKKRYFPFDRERICTVTAYLALELVRRACVGSLGPPATRSPK